MSSISTSLQTLLQRRDIWRPQDRLPAAGEPCGLATGFAALDGALHERGWPRAALTELLLGQPGIGELQLLLPALAALSRQKLWQMWIDPPFVPYAPVLARAGIDLDTLLIVRTEPRQQLWACEQALRCAAMGAVLFWPALPLRYAELRKLQVAAASQQSLAFLFRGANHIAQTSPAALRLQLSTIDEQLAIQIAKQRGGCAGQQVLLPRSSLLQEQTSLSARIAITRGTSVESATAETIAHRRYVPLAERQPLRRSPFARDERHAPR